MPTDKRKNPGNKSSDDQSTVKDLQSDSLSEQDADKVKGGNVSSSDFSFTKKGDKSSPTLS